MRPDVQRWFARRTLDGRDWTAHARGADLVASKGGHRVSVVLPALNEAATVGPIVATIHRELVQTIPLVDEVVVVDSGSTDGTARVASAAGARVVPGEAVLARLGPGGGKGDALWKSLHATGGDLLVFVDADLQDFSADLVTGLVGPLLADPGIDYVKATYDRPLAGSATGGGRVTELVARPLINQWWPRLAGFVQPLAGEYAGRREALEQVPFVCGYGVELALLVDLAGGLGLDALAQVDLGRRVHRNRGEADLGRMANEIMQTAWSRLAGGRPAAAPATQMTQFGRDSRGGYQPVSTDIEVRQRPPMSTIAEYATRRARAS